MTEYLIITEKEILETPNDFELGKLVRMKYIKGKDTKPCPICGAEKECTEKSDESCKK